MFPRPDASRFKEQLPLILDLLVDESTGANQSREANQGEGHLEA